MNEPRRRGAWSVDAGRGSTPNDGMGRPRFMAAATRRLILGLALFVTACSNPSTTSPTPTFSASPVPTPTTPVPTPTPAPTSIPTPSVNAAVLKPNFGVIYWGTQSGYDPGSAPKIRREGETTTLAELAGNYFNQFHGAVSPDGRRAVYPSQTIDGAWSLYLLDGSKPTEQRRLIALPDEIPAQIVWASDGSGVAFTVADSGANQGVAPEYDAIRTLDLATGKATELARITGGNYYGIVGWDKPSNTLAATTFPNGIGLTMSYLVISPAGTKTTPVNAQFWMVASPDARTVVGGLCDGGVNGCSLWTWPLANIEARTDQHIRSGMWIYPFAWRPGSQDIGMVIGSSPNSQDEIDLWSPTAGFRTVNRFINGNTPPGPSFFRADGSALFVPGYGKALVVDLASAVTSALPFPVATGNAFPSTSIRLDVP